MDPSAENPLWSLLKGDLPGRVAAARDRTARGQGPGRDRAKWQALAAEAESPLAGSPEVTEARVSPLIGSRWDQEQAGGQAVYNYYTPPNAAGAVNNYPCGCVATAGAQVMRFFQFPTVGVGTGSFTITVDNTSTTARLRGGDGLGGGLPVGRHAARALLAHRRPTAGHRRADVGRGDCVPDEIHRFGIQRVFGDVEKVSALLVPVCQRRGRPERRLQLGLGSDQHDQPKPGRWAAGCSRNRGLAGRARGGVRRLWIQRVDVVLPFEPRMVGRQRRVVRAAGDRHGDRLLHQRPRVRLQHLNQRHGRDPQRPGGRHRRRPGGRGRCDGQAQGRDLYHNNRFQGHLRLCKPPVQLDVHQFGRQDRLRGHKRHLQNRRLG